jgi:hypothetical protein
MLKQKFTLAIAVLLISNYNYFAQETAKPESEEHADKTFFYEQGLNCTQFVKQYLSFNASSVSNIPYLFTGNLVYKKVGLRYGVNAATSSTNSSVDPTGSNAFNTPTTDKLKSHQYDARFGLFYYKRISKKFTANMGADFIYTTGKTSRVQHSSGSNSGFSTFTSDSNSDTKIQSIGYGPFFSVQYFISSKVSLGTESAIYYSTSSSKQSATTSTLNTFNNGFSVQQNFDTSTTNSSDKSTATNIFVPLSLFVYFRF